MAFEIWLKGEFDFRRLYDFLRESDYVEDLSEIDKGRFTFHLKDVEDITVQIYSNGMFHIVLDHYSRPFHVIWTIRSLCFLSCGKDPVLQLVKFKVLPEDASNYFTRWIMRMAGFNLKYSWIDNLPTITMMMLQDLLYGLCSSEDEALKEFEREDKPEWWKLIESRSEAPQETMLS